MMKRYIKFSYLGLFALFLLVGNAQSNEKIPFTESVVIFNTICAKCHEAQCSGRMSFDDASESSRNHIIRYYGDAKQKKWVQKELFTILNHMKEKCAYYPMKSALPPKKVWSNDLLDKMMTLLERNYFIPLGSFSPGKYRINLELEENAKITVHLISEEFEMVIDDCFTPDNMKLEIPFSITDKGNYYFRMYPKEPTRITRLAVKGVDE